MASSQPPEGSGAVPTDTPSEQPAAAEAAAPTETPGVVEETAAEEEVKAKWPGWPGYSVFRLVVPLLKVGGIIGRKGDLVKKLVEETRARIRVLDGPPTSPDRIVLISGKEEPDAALSPAMNAIIRIFKRVNGLPETDGEGEVAGAPFCFIRLLVPSIQAISLIGKQGSVIKSIQETTGASVRVLSLSNDEVPFYANPEERIAELQGEAPKVVKALEAVVGHLRNFLVDQSVLSLFEKSYNPPATQERQADSLPRRTLLHATPQTSAGDNYPVTVKRGSFFLERDNQMDTRMTSSRHSIYEAEYGLGIRSSTLGRSGEPVVSVSQFVRTMQVPLAYAEDIIGVHGANIDYIRRSSAATLTVQEGVTPEEITVEIKGTSSQIQAAQQLIREFTGGLKELQHPGRPDPSLRPSFSHSYSTTSFPEQPYSSYGSSGVGRFNSFGL